MEFETKLSIKNRDFELKTAIERRYNFTAAFVRQVLVERTVATWQNYLCFCYNSELCR